MTQCSSFVFYEKIKKFAMSLHSKSKHETNRGHLNLSTKETMVGRPAIHHSISRKTLKLETTARKYNHGWLSGFFEPLKSVLSLKFNN